MKNILKYKYHFLFGSMIYLFSFLLVFYMKYSTIKLNQKSIIVLVVIVISWLLASSLSGKFKNLSKIDSVKVKTIFADAQLKNTKENGRNFINKNSPYRSLFLSYFLMLGILSLLSFWIEISVISRYLIAGALVFGLFLEAIFFTIIYKENPRKIKLKIDKFSIASFLIEFGILFIVALIGSSFLFDYGMISDLVSIPLVSLAVCWLISSVISHQFKLEPAANYWGFIWPYFKSYIIFGFLIKFLTFILRIESEVGWNLFVCVILFAFFSLLVFSALYISNAPLQVDEVKRKLIKATAILESEILDSITTVGSKYIVNSNTNSSVFSKQLSNLYLKKFPKIFEFINDKIDLKSCDAQKSVILKSADSYNVEILPANKQELFINLHKINDFSRINYYLKSVNSKLVNGGLFVGCLQPNNLRFIKYLNSYPYYIANLFYFFDFIWYRVVPKLFIAKYFFYTLTKGKNRALSLSEGFGRLYFCGFEMISMKKIDNFVYFIAQKHKSPSNDKEPTYGLLIKLKRIGFEGKTITVYKLRTMHPYSEYIQELVFERLGSINGDKVNNDFRITNWGSLFRRIWLDEFPMLINYIKGDLKIVGVRPLSLHKYNSYPRYLREKRIKCKPGLIPPFYADLPESSEELYESENRYLDEYFNRPIRTDMKYFYKAVYNIIVKRVRSS